MKKVRIGFLSTIALVLTVSFLTMPLTVLAEEKKSDKVLAIVGKQKITESDLYARISLLPPQFRARYETPEGKKKLLEQTVKFTLLTQEARRIGIDKQPEVAQKIKEISDNLIIQELTKQEIIDKLSVTDDDIKKHFEANKEKYTKPAKVKVNLMLFEVKEDAPPEEATKKLKSAEAALKDLKKGKDFEALAKELSDDKRTKKRGGSTGYFSKGKRKNTYGDKFEEKAFSMKVGELSGVFKDKNGYYIIKIADKKAEEVQSLDDVKKRVERQLKQDKQKETYEKYLEELKKKYPVQMME